MVTSEISLELLQSIFRRLHARGWTKYSSMKEIYVFTESNCCHRDNAAISAIERTFKPIGWECKLHNFSIVCDKTTNQPKLFNYTWLLKNMLKT